MEVHHFAVVIGVSQEVALHTLSVFRRVVFDFRDRLRTPAVVHSVSSTSASPTTNACGTTYETAATAHIDPCRSAKPFKVLPLLCVDAERSIWIDANCRLLCDPLAIWDEFEEDLTLVGHWRPDIYHEVCACRSRHKDMPSIVEDAVPYYRASGHPTRSGLWYGTIIVRRHSSDVAQFNEAWWAKIERFSRHDRLSLPVVFRRLGVEFPQFGRDQLSQHTDGS